MIRRKPLVARTPLANKTPIQRRTPLRAKRSIPQPRRLPRDIPPSARATAERRSHGLCEAMLGGCTVVATEMHHRKLRRFGDHRPVNLIHACANCHKGVIHRNVAWSYQHGFLVRSTEDPADIPVKLGCDPGCSCDIRGWAMKLGASH